MSLVLIPSDTDALGWCLTRRTNLKRQCLTDETQQSTYLTNWTFKGLIQNIQTENAVTWLVPNSRYCHILCNSGILACTVTVASLKTGLERIKT